MISPESAYYAGWNTQVCWFNSGDIRKQRDAATSVRIISGEVKQVQKKIADTYITHLIDYIDGYFFTGRNPSGVNTEFPLWIALAKNAFDFKAETHQQKREESFVQLMTTMVQPFTDRECNVALYQYRMLLSRVEKLLQDDGDSSQSLKSIVYRLGTSEKLYRGCELAISVMLSNIGCSTSECGMESLISAMKDNYSVFRPLSINQLHHELMIRKNGPQPLHPSTTKFLCDALNRHFGSSPANWPFIKRSSYFHNVEDSSDI